VRTFALVALAFVVSTGALGCKKRRPPFGAAAGTVTTTGASVGKAKEPPLQVAPTPTWKESVLTFAELPKARGSFSIDKLEGQVTFSGLPEETRVMLGDQTHIAGPGGIVLFKFDLSAAIAKLSPRDAFDYQFKFDPKTTIDLVFSPTAKLSVALPPQSISYALAGLFKGARDVPVALGDGPPRGQHSVLLMGTLTPEALGPAKTIGQIDWIAVGEKQPARLGKVCDGYKRVGDKASDAKTYRLQMVDEKVTVYDVRTSAPVDTREFKAKEQCPMMAFNGAVASYVPADDQKAWLRDLRAKRR
jgi:hypothetical protein